MRSSDEPCRPPSGWYACGAPTTFDLKSAFSIYLKEIADAYEGIRAIPTASYCGGHDMSVTRCPHLESSTMVNHSHMVSAYGGPEDSTDG